MPGSTLAFVRWAVGLCDAGLQRVGELVKCRAVCLHIILVLVGRSGGLRCMHFGSSFCACFACADWVFPGLLCALVFGCLVPRVPSLPPDTCAVSGAVR
eukprot:4361483-Prymnesium_polylepis.1